MSVTREKLYEEVWSKPMTVVAAGYDVSANYLARVCEHLNVPRPSRGYWAKLQFGKRPRRPPLPAARQGEVLEWTKGAGVPRPVRVRVDGGDQQADRGNTEETPSRHPLVLGAREFFEAGRLSEVGYLRPRKRNVVDVFVSKETLTYALDTANELFLALERRGQRVALASGAEHVHRPELSVYQGQKFDYDNREPWTPGRATLVFVGPVAFGLTLFELAEEVEVKLEWNSPVRYVRIADVPPKRRPTWAHTDTTYKRYMPCGRLALRAYSPHGLVTWERRWQESAVGQLAKKFKTIIRELQAAGPEIVSLRDEAEIRAQAERQRWEAERRELERRERERRRAEAAKEARQQLLAIVQEWSVARGLEAFFEDAERRATEMPADDRVALLDRLSKARTMLGGTNALARFREWKPPNDL